MNKFAMRNALRRVAAASLVVVGCGVFTDAVLVNDAAASDKTLSRNGYGLIQLSEQASGQPSDGDEALPAVPLGGGGGGCIIGLNCGCVRRCHAPKHRKPPADRPPAEDLAPQPPPRGGN